MSLLTCWSVKAGSGTTVVTALLALAATTTTFAVDRDGDLVATLGLDEHGGQGLGDWFTDPTTEPAEVAALGLDITARCRVVPPGAAAVADDAGRWADLAAFMAADDALWVVDGGDAPPAALLESRAGSRRVLVQRACYVALRRAQLRQPATAANVDAIVFVQEPGRALDAGDVAAVLGTSVTATVGVDPKIGRAIDAGTLALAAPTRLLNHLRPLTHIPERHLHHPASAAHR